MKPISKAIQEYMEDCLGIYDNPYGVEICFFEDLICISANWPRVVLDDYHSLELAFECCTFDEFTNTLALSHISEFHALTPGRLLELYLDGKAEVRCFIDRIVASYELNFLKKGKILWARNHNDDKHIVPISLDTPTQFFEYLKVYANSKKIIL